MSIHSATFTQKSESDLVREPVDSVALIMPSTAFVRISIAESKVNVLCGEVVRDTTFVHGMQHSNVNIGLLLELRTWCLRKNHFFRIDTSHGEAILVFKWRKM